MAATAVDDTRVQLLTWLRRVYATDQLRALRESVGLRQSEVAAAIGVDRSTVCKWESRRRLPTGDAAVAYARLLRSAVAA